MVLSFLGYKVNSESKDGTVDVLSVLELLVKRSEKVVFCLIDLILSHFMWNSGKGQGGSCGNSIMRTNLVEIIGPAQTLASSPNKGLSVINYLQVRGSKVVDQAIY